jgi:hypothetical protein
MANVTNNSKRNILVPTKRNIEFGSFDDSKAADSSLQPKFKKDSFSTRTEPQQIPIEGHKDEAKIDIPDHAIEKFLQVIVLFLYSYGILKWIK